MSGRTLVAHATNLCARGFLVSDPDRTVAPSGTPTGALFALTRALRTALSFKTPELAVAVIDAAGVPDAPPALAAQLPLLPELLRAHGLAVVETADAADAVASYTEAALALGHDVVVVGSDKRLAQLVSDRVWWYDAYKDVRYTPEVVAKRFEVGPAHVAEWLALVGDDDTLPGIAGIGKKGATELLARYGTVAAALAHLDAIKGRTGNALRAAREAIPAELARARLDRARPLPRPLEACTFTPPAAPDLAATYRALGLFGLLGDEGGASVEVTVCDRRETVQLVLQSFARGPVALHALTEDPTPVHGALVGLALAGPDGRTAYVPFQGKGPRVDPSALAAFLEDPSVPKVGHDLKGAVIALARHGIALRGILGDSACASHLAEPSGWAPHDLPIVARQVLHRGLPEEDAVRGVGRARKRWAAVPIERAAAFAGAMAEASLAVWQALAPTTDRALLEEYLALAALLVRMEQKGIACDAADLARVGDDFERIGAELEREIFALAGHELNLGSTKQLGTLLFEELGLPIALRTKTGWSTSTEALERIEHAHPIVALVIRWRMLRRLTDTWVTALAAAIDPDGRVRSTFYPARSFSGRLVNASPDLGRVPKKTPEMRRIRHAFHAPPGAVLLSVDYEQLGLYVLAHLTGDPALVEPLERGLDLHTLTAAAVLEIPVESVDYDDRQRGKVVNFATFAGQGASALALQLGVSAQEAKTLIERFDRRYAVVRAFQDEQLRLVREQGYVVTLAGRRWPIGGLGSPDPMLRGYAERLARRATHEGSVADVARRGLLRAGEALRDAGLAAMPLLQILDEVLFEVPERELATAARIAADAMRTAFALRVPLRVGVRAGARWADLAPFEA